MTHLIRRELAIERVNPDLEFSKQNLLTELRYRLVERVSSKDFVRVIAQVNHKLIESGRDEMRKTIFLGFFKFKKRDTSKANKRISNKRKVFHCQSLPQQVHIYGLQMKDVKT